MKKFLIVLVVMVIAAVIVVVFVKNQNSSNIEVKHKASLRFSWIPSASFAGDRVGVLEKKLSDIQLVTGFKRCRGRRQYRAFLEQEVGIPDEKWRDYHWLIGGSRRPRNEGGIEKDLRCIHGLIVADERFGSLPAFRDWMDGNPVQSRKMPPPRDIQTAEQADEMVREVCGAEGLADMRELISDWARFQELCRRHPGLDRAIILLSQD
jgi:hypothetical protein